MFIFSEIKLFTVDEFNASFFSQSGSAIETMLFAIHSMLGPGDKNQVCKYFSFVSVFQSKHFASQRAIELDILNSRINFQGFCPVDNCSIFSSFSFCITSF